MKQKLFQMLLTIGKKTSEFPEDTVEKLRRSEIYDRDSNLIIDQRRRKTFYSKQNMHVETIF